jgi:glycogen operon protein
VEIEPGLPYPIGPTPSEGGTNFAVASEIADAVEICLFDDDGLERRLELPKRTADVFHGFVPGVGAGQRYGVRVHGPWAPSDGLRCNPNKLLLDPYARAISGSIAWGQPVFSHHFDDQDRPDESDSADAMPRGVIVDSAFEWGSDRSPRIPIEESVIYETHVKGFTQRRAEIPEALRGTYAGLGHPASVEYLTGLGVTAVEILPVHEFVHDEHLLRRGLRNYWGYNSIGFFAPHGAYSSSSDRGGQVTEFKSMVASLHAAGLEVILDVVFNHTAEGNEQGPTLSMKGIDNRAYYRLVEGDSGHYFDTTGTGNSFNVDHPTTLRLIMDSLRYWVNEMHVDGFRFDLATTLTRQKGDADPHSAFLDLVAQDPVLAPVKLIAEPWDVAGFQLGGFPSRWSEWNGRYRDAVRDFWRGEGTVGEFALRLSGSGDLYSSRRRAPTASVNFITAHDGFTLADLTEYDEKHNDENGEENRDGTDDNRSWNCGAEGPTDDEGIQALRRSQRRVMLATLLFSAGVPMVLGGDELGRTQAGNNNAYCQDSEISWYDWDAADEELLAFTTRLIAVRRAHIALRPSDYLRGPEGGVGQIILYRPTGELMEADDWTNPGIRTLAVALDGRQIVDEDGATSPDRLLLCINGFWEPIEFALPGPSEWRTVISTADGPECEVSATGSVMAPPRSLTLLQTR